MNNNLLAMYYAQAPQQLPAGYRRVLYLQSTGSQYIDAGFQVRASYSAVIDQDMDFYRLGVRNFAIGTYRSNGTGGRMINAEYTASNYARIWQHSTANIVGDTALTSTRHVYTTQIDSNVTMKADDVVMAQMARYTSSNYVTYPFKLFTDGRAGTFGGQKHYFTRATVNGTMVRLMVPAVRVSDDKPGLYDLCGSICPLTNNPFYINSGTGQDFTWGEI